MDIWTMASILIALTGLLRLLVAQMRQDNVIIRGSRHDTTPNTSVSAGGARHGQRNQSNLIHAHDTPFNCAAFSIVSRKSIGGSQGERWLVDFTSPEWEDISKGVLKRAKYDEDEFRRLAALEGWRLVNIVLASGKERRLYYERVF